MRHRGNSRPARLAPGEIYIPSGRVRARYRPYDDETVIPGSELRNGMVVVLRDPAARGNYRDQHLGSLTQLHHLLANSRWCMVDGLCFQEYGGRRLVYFSGVYSTGQRHPRHIDVALEWIVRRDTFPPPPSS